MKTTINRELMGRFCTFINDFELKEIPLLGHHYSWLNDHDAPILVRLDRMPCTTDWEEMFPDFLLQSQATQISDHCPLVLGLYEGSHGKKRFYFESFWTKLRGFHDVVAESWNKPIMALTRALQSRGQKQVGHIKTQLGLA